MTGTLTGSWTNWVLCNHGRKYGTVQNIPFEQANELIMAHGYNGQTGKGQQRAIVESHAKKIKQEMRAGNFTPTPISAALEKRHLELLTLNDDGTFSLTVNSKDPLLQTDGGHRFEALKLLSVELAETLAKEKDEGEIAVLSRWLKEIKALPITVTVYFDGNAAKDFVNLQAGRAVDASHLKSLSIQAGVSVNPAIKMAHQIARELHGLPGSLFLKSIKFDSRGTLPLPISTLTASGSSDLGTSLVGVAKVGLAANKSAASLAKIVVEAHKALSALDASQEGDDGILSVDKVLTPVENDGSKGSSTMLVGVGVCLAHRVLCQGRETVSADDVERLKRAAQETLNKKVGGGFSGPQKRKYLGQFAKAFFADVETPKHQGIPTSLLKVVSCSAFGVEALPKEVKSPKPAKATKKSSQVDNLPNLAAPATVTVTNEPIMVVAPALPAEVAVPWEQSETPATAASSPWSGDEIQA